MQSLLKAVVYAFNWEAEANRSLYIQGQPGLHGKFQASHNYTVRLLSQNKQNKKEYHIRDGCLIRSQESLLLSSSATARTMP